MDELFLIMHTKSYMPGYSQQQAVPPTPAPFNPPSAPSTFLAQPAPLDYAHSAPQQSRKRSYNESNEGAGSEDPNYARSERHIKQMRRGGGRGNRGDVLGGRGRGNYHQPPLSHGGPSPSLPNFQGMPIPPPGSFEDPMAMLTAMQAMGLPPLPSMPPFAQARSPPAPQYGQGSPGQPAKNKINARCRDYDTKGYCTRGVNCPFQHENSVIMPDQEYDPKNAVMTDVQMSPTTPKGLNLPLSDTYTNGYARGGGRGRGRGDRGGYTPGRKNRADFSHSGPNHDRSITTIVVEQIPEENFDEQSVRTFFSQFGTIDEVDMRPYKRLALVKFSDWASANRAYSSPKVIFDNRFVKVFWFKPTTELPTEASPNGKPDTTTTTSPADPEFDREKFMRDAEAAQRKLEEKRALLKDSEEKRQALEKQKAELAKRQAEEKRKLQEKLAAKGHGSPPASAKKETNGTTTANGEKDEAAIARTNALKEQVAALEAEAKSLGLDHALSEDPNAAPYGRGRGRGRGSYRGWEGFAGRGGYQPRGRGAYRGRGGFGAYNLDLRPRKVSVSGVEWTSERDEGLRQYLLVSLPSPNPVKPSIIVQ